jgi:molecular chaperone GrpE
MTEPPHKGPSVDIPSDLAEELEDASQEAASGERASGEGEGMEARREAGAGEDQAAERNAEAAKEQVEPGAPSVEDQLRAEIEVLKDRYLRMAAEHQNQRRRTLREQQDAIQFANENLVKELLATVDNLERALGHARSGEGGTFNPEKLVEGVELTRRSLANALERNGVERIEAVGAKFDPRHHEAVRQIPTADQEPNTVVEVYQVGYLFKGRLLRPAMVAVASRPAQEPS